MGKSIHGHYGENFEREAERLMKLCKEKLNIDLRWVEATNLAAERSASMTWSPGELKKAIARLRGIE